MKIKVWDLPTRLFHWLLVLTYIGAFLTSASDRFLDFHTIYGYIALGLVVFRVLWGAAGNRFARFSNFVRGWVEVKNYFSEALKVRPPRYLGHNPAVAWVIVSVLVLTAAIIATGIVTYGGEENKGLWAGVFSFNAGYYAGKAHAVLASLAVILIAIHICAALFHDFILRENIILSMVTGNKEDEESYKERVSHIPPEEGRSPLRLAVWIFIVVMLGLGLVFLPPKGKSGFLKLEQPKIIDENGFAVEFRENEDWKAECASSCHNAFHPTLLPAGSWKKIMAGLDDHFGDMVTLDNETASEIEKYLSASSAERSTTEASKKMLRSLRNSSSAPERITDIPYWKIKHSDISADVFAREKIVSKSNCLACHPGAEAGSFEDNDITIPE